MASSFSALLRFELPAAGEQAGVWNITFNRNLGGLAEQSISGITTLNLASGDRQLTALNGTVDEARSAVLMLTGIKTTPTIIDVPSSNKVYDIWNLTDSEVTIRLPNSEEYLCPYQSKSYITIHDNGQAVKGVSVTALAQSMLGAGTPTSLLGALGVAPLHSPILEGAPTVPTAPDGDKTDLVANTEFVYRNGVPPGAIVIWPLQAHQIPIGWRLCDGSNNTPDLRDRFIIGATSSADVGTIGGYEDATLPAHSHGGTTSGQSANHTHNGSTSSAGAHTHGGVYVPGAHGTNQAHKRYYAGARGNTASAGDHSHSFTTGTESASHTHSISTQGSDAKGKNMPPYIALIYIMKE